MKGVVVLLGGLFAVSLGLLVWYGSSYEGVYRQYESKSLELENIKNELKRANAEIAELKLAKSNLNNTHSKPSSLPMHGMLLGDEEASKKTPKETKAERVERIAAMQTAAIQRIVTVTPDEKEELKDMFSSRQEENEKTPSLEDVLGEERANLVRGEQRKAFSRSEVEDIERDTYYFARKFELTPQQEVDVLNALTEVQQRVNDEREITPANTPRERLMRMVNETKLYRRLLMERMQQVMTQQQLSEYIKYDQESSAADMELWHSPPDDGEEG